MRTTFLFLILSLAAAACKKSDESHCQNCQWTESAYDSTGTLISKQATSIDVVCDEEMIPVFEDSVREDAAGTISLILTCECNEP